MNSKKLTYGFGVDLSETQNHFYVIIPPRGGNAPIEIYERFAWTPKGLSEEDLMVASGVKDPKELKIFADGQVIQTTDVLRLRISRHKWNMLAKDFTSEFNSRLREKKIPIGKFMTGGTPVERLFGKEMMVLLWGIEDCDPSNIPTAIRNWKGLMPEERWWLYTTTNASTGGLNDRKGWRTALRYALCENPIYEYSLFDNLDEDTLK